MVAAFDFRAEDAVPVFEGWRDQCAVAPRQATFMAEVNSTSTGPIATVGFVWVGDPEQGKGLLPAMEALGRPVETRVTTPSYLELRQRLDIVGGHRYRRYMRGHYLREFPTSGAHMGRAEWSWNGSYFSAEIDAPSSCWRNSGARCALTGETT
jgi:hypothetical protein